jgi:hypothetical protein
LIARDAGDGQLDTEDVLARDAEIRRAVAHLGQTAQRNVEQLAQLAVPTAGANVEQRRAARVGDIGRVHPAAGQAPDEKAVDRPERQLARLRGGARSRHPIQDPLELRRGEIGIEPQAGFLGERAPMAGLLQGAASFGSAPVLPYDGVVDRYTGASVPDEGGLTLVGEADGGRRPTLFA